MDDLHGYQGSAIITPVARWTDVMELFDTHCHLDVEEFDEDRNEVLAAARAGGVSELLVPAVQRATWPALIRLCAGDAGLIRHWACTRVPVPA